MSSNASPGSSLDAQNLASKICGVCGDKVFALFSLFYSILLIFKYVFSLGIGMQLWSYNLWIM